MEFEGLPERPHAPAGDVVGRVWEHVHPYAGGVLVAIVSVVALCCCPGVFAGLGGSCGRLFDGAVGFSSIMAGFTSTLLGLLFSVRETRKVRVLERTGHFKTLKSYLSQAIHVNILLCVVSIAASIVVDAHPGLRRWIAISVLSLFACSVLTVLRVARLMARLL